MATTPKDYEIQLDTKNKIPGEPISLVQGDNDGNIFHFTLTENDEPIDLTDTLVSITMIKADNTVVVNECTITDALSGKCDYTVHIDALSCIGQVVYTVEIYKNSRRTTTTQAKFKVVGQLDDGTGSVSHGNYNILSTLIERVAETEVIVTQNEAIRQGNEQTRESNESIRESQEQNRINTFNANETARQVNETVRISNENVRVSNETARVEEFNTLKIASENATAYAISRGNYANDEGNKTKEATTELRETISDYTNVVEQSKKIYMPLVNTYNDILTTYPVPQVGWTVQTKDTHIEYRWDGVEWVDIGVTDAFNGYNVYVGSTPPIDKRLLWVYSNKTSIGSGMVRIIPSIEQPIDKSQIWLKLT